MLIARNSSRRRPWPARIFSVCSVARPSSLAEHATAIRALGRQTVENIIEIGRRLVDCRDHHLEHGEWLPWLSREFGWSRQTADNFIHVYEAQGKLPNFGNLDLPVSALYLLAAPSTPERARSEIIERADAGEALPVAEVKRVVDKHKGATKACKPSAKRPEKPAVPLPQVSDEVLQQRAASAERLRALLGKSGPGDNGSTKTTEATKLPEMRDDVGPGSHGELARLQARLEELEPKAARLERENIGLRSEVEELQASSDAGKGFSHTSWAEKSPAEQGQIVAAWGSAIIASMDITTICESLPDKKRAELERRAANRVRMALREVPASKERAAEVALKLIEKVLREIDKQHGPPVPAPESGKEPLYCSFCGKGQHEVVH